MKFILLVIVLIFYIIKVDSFDLRKKLCQDYCRDEDFDRLICAFDGNDLRNFSGSCRMKFFNDCYQMNFKEVDSSRCRQT
ncbi:hypothetical protein PVAND_000689 [Polypedilum vanderplanki]|uniref:Uncharacterized protein n=1 Tax=Polypedilum vanderplanki TaxID=319348 RepID=A0A9J6BLC6_POLVA|nr:hypothetical protein PVAND_000689 [Polypedilum vanderplanki]